MSLSIQRIIVLLCGATGAAIPFAAFYWFWSWCMAQVPMASEWAGLIKIGITVVLLAIGGMPVGLAAFWLAIMAAAMAITLTD